MESKYHFRFEDLQIYQKAIDFGELVNILTKKFPRDERFELTSQFKRASDSIALNTFQRKKVKKSGNNVLSYQK